MTEKTPDRIEFRFGSFRASAYGKLAVGGLLLFMVGALLCKAFGVI